MQERFYSAVGPIALSASGTTDGELTLVSTLGFKVKMRVLLADPIAPDINLEVKRVHDETTLEVGPLGGSINDRTDVSAYSATSTLFACRQKRPSIPENERDRYVYCEEPSVAIRTCSVDPWGRPYTTSNPLPTSASFTGTVQADLTHLDDDPNPGDVHDSIRIGHGIPGRYLIINPDGSINVVFGLAGTEADVRASTLVTLNNATFTEIINMPVLNGQTFVLNEICCALKGFTAHFMVEYFDGSTTDVIRQYILSTQQSTFTETIERPLEFVSTSDSAKVLVKALMLGVNQDGEGFASLNGYK